MQSYIVRIIKRDTKRFFNVEYAAGTRKEARAMARSTFHHKAYALGFTTRRV